MTGTGSGTLRSAQRSAHLGRDRDDAVVEVVRHRVEPLAQPCAGRLVPATQQLDATAQLADHQHRQPELVGLVFVEPCPHAGVGPRTLAQVPTPRSCRSGSLCSSQVELAWQVALALEVGVGRRRSASPTTPRPSPPAGAPGARAGDAPPPPTGRAQPRGASDAARGPRRGCARSTEPLLSTISTTLRSSSDPRQGVVGSLNPVHAAGLRVSSASLWSPQKRSASRRRSWRCLPRHSRTVRSRPA